MNIVLQHLMERNVLEVFGERDPGRRKSVIDELYTEDCTFSDFDSDDRSVGRDALNARVEDLLAGIPGFVFRLVGPAEVIQDVGRGRWHLGPRRSRSRCRRDGRGGLQARSHCLPVRLSRHGS